MYNLLLLFKLATELEGKFKRSIIIKYLQYKLKNEFFIPFKNMIENDTVSLTETLLESFVSFYFMQDMNECKYYLSYPHITRIYDKKGNTRIEIRHTHYIIRYEFLDTIVRIKELKDNGKWKSYPYKDFYISDYAKLLLISIYNRSIIYIYDDFSDSNGLYTYRKLFCYKN